MNNKKIALFVIGLLVIFLLMRLPGISLPYHQDEWKNVAASSSADEAGAFFAHPPLMQILFVAGYFIFGEDNFRIFPLIFGIASAFLLYIVVRHRAGAGPALWSLLLYTVSFWSIFASLQPDVDGAILPFFLLLSVYAYDRFFAVKERKWFILLVTFLLLGFLVKLNFILVIGALIFDYILGSWKDFSLKKLALSILGICGFALAYIAALFLIQVVYPAFSINFMLGHAGQFTGEGGRSYTQVVVQGMKAIYFLSPLLLIPLIFLSREIFVKTRIFFVYLVFGFLFYFVFFDFSRGALDKYLMFAIAPLSIIVGMIFSQIFKQRTAAESFFANYKWPIIIGATTSVLFLALNFLPQATVALYPKTEWFSRVLRGEWAILTPFTGGSGPVGFYVSFLFIAASFIASVVFAVVGFFKKNWKPAVAVILIIIGVSYNALFAEELLMGKINGSVKSVIGEVTSFIDKASEIKKVMSYNDIGAHELSRIGKYEGRFYATPDFEEGHRKKFAAFDGHVLGVNIPQLYENGFYGRFFSNCSVLFETRSREIEGRVYDCATAKKLINSL